ncbi:LuxR C-terminal-related transcriptional regulator [Amycolatopsis magusensis]|uniref:LuxR family transcriptional regulator n=1 Tax=Amycolatopsis magusensis TaxID=882444 RepID=UPI003C2E867F
MAGEVLVFGTGALAVGLCAALATRGWVCVTAGVVPSPEAVLLVGDAVVRGRDVIIALSARAVPIVAVGPIRTPVPMIAALLAGATEVADADLPFTELLDLVGRGLSARPAPVGGWADRRRTLLEKLRDRRRDELLLARLTERERQVLRALAAGQAAREIAAAELVGLSTVRSHIHSILRKLEVSSQLAAVAVGRRGWRGPNLSEQQL